MKKLLILSFLMAMLSACGGGGSGAVTDVPGLKAPAAVTAVSAN